MTSCDFFRHNGHDVVSHFCPGDDPSRAFHVWLEGRGEETDPHGFGATEDAALADLFEQVNA